MCRTSICIPRTELISPIYLSQPNVSYFIFKYTGFIKYAIIYVTNCYYFSWRFLSNILAKSVYSHISQTAIIILQLPDSERHKLFHILKGLVCWKLGTLEKNSMQLQMKNKKKKKTAVWHFVKEVIDAWVCFAHVGSEQCYLPLHLLFSWSKWCNTSLCGFLGLVFFLSRVVLPYNHHVFLVLPSMLFSSSELCINLTCIGFVLAFSSLARLTLLLTKVKQMQWRLIFFQLIIGNCSCPWTSVFSAHSYQNKVVGHWLPVLGI